MNDSSDSPVAAVLPMELNARCLLEIKSSSEQSDDFSNEDIEEARRKSVAEANQNDKQGPSFRAIIEEKEESDASNTRSIVKSRSLLNSGKGVTRNFAASERKMAEPILNVHTLTRCFKKRPEEDSTKPATFITTRNGPSAMAMSETNGEKREFWRTVDEQPGFTSRALQSDRRRATAGPTLSQTEEWNQQ